MARRSTPPPHDDHDDFFTSGDDDGQQTDATDDEILDDVLAALADEEDDNEGLNVTNSIEATIAKVVGDDRLTCPHTTDGQCPHCSQQTFQKVLRRLQTIMVALNTSINLYHTIIQQELQPGEDLSRRLYYLVGQFQLTAHLMDPDFLEAIQTVEGE